MNIKKKSKKNKKRIISLLFSLVVISSLASCSDEPETNLSTVSNTVSEISTSDTSNSSEQSQNVSESSEGDSSIDPSLIEKFPEKKLSHSVMDDGNFYLKVQTVNGDYTCIREYAAKGENIYANEKNDDSFLWYYSNGRATFSFDDENKEYKVYSPRPLHIELFGDVKEEDGECDFFGVESTYVKYKLDEKMSIMHFYRKSDGSWLGFQYLYENKYEEVNLVLDASEEYPSHAVFSIPEDYTYYYKDNVVSIDWS